MSCTAWHIRPRTSTMTRERRIRLRPPVDPFSTCNDCGAQLMGYLFADTESHLETVLLSCGHILCPRCVLEYKSTTVRETQLFECHLCRAIVNDIILPHSLNKETKKCRLEGCKNSNSPLCRKCDGCDFHFCEDCFAKHRAKTNFGDTLCLNVRLNPVVDEALEKRMMNTFNLSDSMDKLLRHVNHAEVTLIRGVELLNNEVALHFNLLILMCIQRCWEVMAAVKREGMEHLTRLRDTRRSLQEARRLIDVGIEIDERARDKRNLQNEGNADLMRTIANKLCRKGFDKYDMIERGPTSCVHMSAPSMRIKYDTATILNRISTWGQDMLSGAPGQDRLMKKTIKPTKVQMRSMHGTRINLNLNGQLVLGGVISRKISCLKHFQDLYNKAIKDCQEMRFTLPNPDEACALIPEIEELDQSDYSSELNKTTIMHEPKGAAAEGMLNLAHLPQHERVHSKKRTPMNAPLWYSPVTNNLEAMLPSAATETASETPLKFMDVSAIRRKDSQSAPWTRHVIAASSTGVKEEHDATQCKVEESDAHVQPSSSTLPPDVIVKEEAHETEPEGCSFPPIVPEADVAEDPCVDIKPDMVSKSRRKQSKPTQWNGQVRCWPLCGRVRERRKRKSLDPTLNSVIQRLPLQYPNNFIQWKRSSSFPPASKVARNPCHNVDQSLRLQLLKPIKKKMIRMLTGMGVLSKEVAPPPYPKPQPLFVASSSTETPKEENEEDVDMMEAPELEYHAPSTSHVPPPSLTPTIPVFPVRRVGRLKGRQQVTGRVAVRGCSFNGMAVDKPPTKRRRCPVDFIPLSDSKDGLPHWEISKPGAIPTRCRPNILPSSRHVKKSSSAGLQSERPIREESNPDAVCIQCSSERPVVWSLLCNKCIAAGDEPMPNLQPEDSPPRTIRNTLAN